MSYFRDTKHKVFYISLKEPSARILFFFLSYMLFDYNDYTLDVTKIFLGELVNYFSSWSSESQFFNRFLHFPKQTLLSNSCFCKRVLECHALVSILQLNLILFGRNNCHLRPIMAIATANRIIERSVYLVPVSPYHCFDSFLLRELVVLLE